MADGMTVTLFSTLAGMNVGIAVVNDRNTITLILNEASDFPGPHVMTRQ